MYRSVQNLQTAIEDELGRFIVLWLVVGGAITFGVVVVTAQYNWPGYVYVFIWLALGLLLTPLMLRSDSESSI